MAQKNYWIIVPEKKATKWDNWQEEGIISIGWDEIGNYKDYENKKEITKALKAEGRRNPIQTASMIYSFANKIQIGDIVFAKTGWTKLLGYGEVLSDYEYSADREEHKHIRKVRWIKTGEWDTKDFRFGQKTLTLANKLPYLEKIKRLIDFDAIIIDEAKPPLCPYTLADALKDLFYEENEFQEIVDVLSFKKNIILQGAPGVGKTFIAKRLAYCLMGEKADNRVEMIQFHQSYSYEDFIQGYRPDENCGFVRKNGVFYEFCQKAKNDTANKYVFIIDEINRGNLSKIFGELMMLIESDKRGGDFSLPLTYAQSGEDKFYIPENVYLIGTMNTADRSLAMVDYALRRRFAFITLEPKFGDKFRDFLMYKNVASKLIGKIVAGMNGLNEKIKADDKNLGKGYQIGHSFFCGNGDNNAMDEHWYQRVIKYEIKTLLEEYWFDDENKVQTQINELLG